MPIYEFCAENVTYLEKAFQAGAQRVELCDNLAVGGTTPSYGVIKAAVEMAKDYQAKVIVMIRPRGGDFVSCWKISNVRVTWVLTALH